MLGVRPARSDKGLTTAEARRDELQAQVDYNFVVGSRSRWENKTQKVIEKNRALRRFAELQAAPIRRTWGLG